MTSQPDTSDRDRATRILINIVEREREPLSPAIALELAKHLCHLAGGDGRGTYTIVHDPNGDRV